jgi:hypothetical protein
LCDRVLIGLMVFRSRTSARLLAMKVEDVFVQNSAAMGGLREKGSES